jgi:hypothetical protein
MEGTIIERTYMLMLLNESIEEDSIMLTHIIPTE